MSISDTPMLPSWSTRPFHCGSARVSLDSCSLEEETRLSSEEDDDEPIKLEIFLAKLKPDELEDDLAYFARFDTFLYI